MHFGTAQLIERRIRQAMPELHRWAESMACGCKRKQVGFALYQIGADGYFQEVCRTHNGPVGAQCANVVGGCGCAHSEPRLMMEAIRRGRHLYFPDSIFRHIVLGTYSPCSFCANTIVDAKVADVVVYDILTEHDKRGVEILNRGLSKGCRSLGELTYQEIETWTGSK